MTAPPSPVTSAATPTFRRRIVLACALLLAAAAGAAARAQTTQPYRPTLLAYGTSSRLWVATVEAYKDGAAMRMKTVIREQELPGGAWRELGTLYAHALAMAQVQGDLAVLVDDGVWKRVGVSGLATGPAIPGTGPVLGWGSSVSTLYAVRGVEGGKDALAKPAAAARAPAAAAAAPTTNPASRATPATRPSVTTRPTAATRPTTAAAAATAPTTRPATPVLMKYDRGAWQAVTELPAGVAAGPVAVTVFGGKPVVAAAVGGLVRVFAFGDGAWQDWGEVRPESQAARFDLITAPNLVALWTIDLAGAMRLHVRREGDGWVHLAGFKLPEGIVPDAARTLAAAGEEFRLETAKDGKVTEQRYDLTGVPRGTLSALPAPQAPQPNHAAWILQTVALLVMVVVLIAFYRRRAAQAPAADETDARR
jgi:hypothetical protein